MEPYQSCQIQLHLARAGDTVCLPVALMQSLGHTLSQVSEIANLGVYWLFLVLCRPYDDTIFMTYEIITSRLKPRLNPPILSPSTDAEPARVARRCVSESEFTPRYEIITNSAQLAMLIVIILGYYELIETPKGAFIGLIALVLLGQILTQVRFGRVQHVGEELQGFVFSQLQGIAHERIMFTLEIVHMVFKRFNWYKERQEKVMERVKR